MHPNEVKAKCEWVKERLFSLRNRRKLLIDSLIARSKLGIESSMDDWRYKAIRNTYHYWIPSRFVESTPDDYRWIVRENNFKKDKKSERAFFHKVNKAFLLIR